MPSIAVLNLVWRGAKDRPLKGQLLDGKKRDSIVKPKLKGKQGSLLCFQQDASPKRGESLILRLREEILVCPTGGVNVETGSGIPAPVMFGE
jgi:hypothetical protein